MDTSLCPLHGTGREHDVRKARRILTPPIARRRAVRQVGASVQRLGAANFRGGNLTPDTPPSSHQVAPGRAVRSEPRVLASAMITHVRRRFMKMTNSLPTLALCCMAAVCLADGLGPFESSGDVGVTPQKGKVEFDAGPGEYRVTGGGANIWATADAFQFVWKKMSGDVALTA